MLNRIFAILTLFASFNVLQAQMRFNGQSMYGNEWIDPAQQYFKLTLSADGIYRISYDDMVNAGMPVQGISMDRIFLYRFGQEVAMYTSSKGIITASDYIEFFGKKNRGELDKVLFRNPADQFNIEHSMFTDESAYYLVIKNSSSTSRINSIQNDVSNPLPKDLYFLNTTKMVFTNESNKRSTRSKEEEKFPDFDESQGFSSNFLTNHTFDIEFKNLYKNDIPASIKLVYSGKHSDDRAHNFHFLYDDSLYQKDNFTGFKTRTTILNILPDQLKSKFKINAIGNDVGGFKDEIGISNITLNYPSEFKFNNANYYQFSLPASSIDKYLEIESFDGGDNLNLYDITNNLRLIVNKSGAIYKVKLPPSVKEREIIIVNASQINSLSKLTKINFVDYNNFNKSADYIILTSKKFIQTPQGLSALQEYEQYRSSAAGGAYKINTVYTEDINELFGFGIENHNIAIRNFFQYSRKIWPNVKYVLIVGKGMHYAATKGASAADVNSYLFVPTYGYPGADNLFVSDSLRNPFYALGRIPCLNGKELLDYLSKVKGHEAVLKNSAYNIQNREWVKKVIHLSGGDPQIYAVLRSQMAEMESILENNQFGAEVTTFYKESSSAIEIADIEALRNLVNGGVSIISFLGHSAAFKLDYNVESVYSYNNKDKYHLFIAMGCYAGQMHENFRSVSEQFNLPADRGSIIFLSNSTAGIPNTLGIYNSELYRLIGGRLYGAAIGDIVKETSIEILKNQDEASQTQAISISFDGDPAIRMHNNLDQDFTIDASTISTNPTSIFSSQDSFGLKFDILNLGASYKDSVVVKIEQQLPNGVKQVVFEKNIASPTIRTNFEFKIPTNGDAAIGFNKIFITLDPANTILEGPRPYAEQNNELLLSNGDKCYTYYLIGNDAKPVYPEEFSIVTQNFPILIANNGNALAPKTNYYFEIDTTEYFNSPLKSSKVNFQTGGVISWSTGLNLIPSKVYYWRVRPELTNVNVNAWKGSSFIFLPSASKGWNQSHYFQFLKDSFVDIELKEPIREFDYADKFFEFRAINSYIEIPAVYFRPQIYFDSKISMDYRYDLLRSNVSGILISVFDPHSGQLWRNSDGQNYGSDGIANNANYQNTTFFQFDTDTKSNRDDVINFLENVVPDNAVVVLHTLRQQNYSFYPELWESDGNVNIYSVLNKYKAVQINELKTRGSLPYILVYRKNNPDFEVKEAIGDTINQFDISHGFKLNKTEGRVLSTTIGPASSWEKFLWNYNKFDPNVDRQYVYIYGIDTAGSEKLLFGPFIDLEQDLRSVDVKEYPKMKLEWYSSDTTNKTAPNLDYWRIHYKGLPDIAFNPSFLYSKNKDTLDQGEFFKLEIMAQNISDYPMDSLLVKFDLIDERNTNISSLWRTIPVQAQAAIKIPYEVSTNGQSGNYRLIIELNPGMDQPELNAFNNVAIVNYFVRGDTRNPLLDVVFDGIHIANEDIVSSKTKIQITLSDENAFLPLNDTSLFEIKLVYPGNNGERKISFSDKDIIFTPAIPGSKNEAVIIICGDFIYDGIYELHVKAKDPSGNQVSTGNYIISFRIIKEQSVSNLLNYPNPFSDRTRFVYTLTGAEMPSYYKIQIMTVSGKVVKEITQNELGKLKIGTHMTDYEYNGTDDFGSKLANGVYLYRFIIKNEKGEDYKKLNGEKYNFESTDQFFKNNFGKMVILR